jgi:hypothetical protein
MRVLMGLGAVCTLATVIVLAPVASTAAHEWAHSHRYKRHTSMTYVQYAPAYTTCRVGWWQTLRYGHVRPHWGTWCRYSR